MATTYRKPPQALQSILKADEIISTVKSILAEQTAVRAHIANSITPSQATFANTVAPCMAVDDKTQGVSGVCGMLRYSGPDEDTRRAVRAAHGLWDAASAERLASRKFFQLLDAVRRRADAGEEELGHEERKVLEDLWGDYRLAGHGTLNGDEIAVFLERRRRVEEVKVEIQENLKKQEAVTWFAEKELEGVSEEDMKRWEAKDGGRVVLLARASYDAVMKYAHDEDVRRRMFVAYENRYEKNVALYKSLLILRDENARLLGYGSHADLRVEKRTAPSVEWVQEFMERLGEELLPRGRREVERLRDRKSKHLGEDGVEMMPWDFAYYTRLLENEADVDHGLIAEYFPLQHTLSSMLGLFTEFLGLEFVPVPEGELEGKLWADDIVVWSVWEGREERKGEFVGYLYADVLWREGKYRGNCNVNLQCGYVKEDGTRVYPATILMYLVCRTKYTRFHGTRVAPDFGEAPSTMLENWCWMPQELIRMSRHYTRVDPAYIAKWEEDHQGKDLPPERIPDELVERLANSRGLNRALWFLRQLVFAKFDLEVNHQKSTSALRELDEVKLFHDLNESLTLRHNPYEKGFGHVHSTHLISLYDAGYYAYIRHACSPSHFCKEPARP
ncbi:Saccharolysin [Colletotrichum orbiculare MAFF 240422]|uniref:Saccharolysin n=1 Tax=Colletotrichum orbiculare (strain 104-T / ATCC 96160 / CBS 514.97 / LARS 414 / MAFF 240422) TaxID=1213857 RepID=A0A484FC70_COLOR|nr:Saccharolysin [Colletotrichum orbiculare MAFF 240422]